MVKLELFFSPPEVLCKGWNELSVLFTQWAVTGQATRVCCFKLNGSHLLGAYSTETTWREGRGGWGGPARQTDRGKNACNLTSHLWAGLDTQRDFRIMCLFKNRVAIWFCNPTSGHISRHNYNSKRYTHPNVHSSTIYNSQDMETT